MDIGGGLRATPNRGNRYDKTLRALDLLLNDIQSRPIYREYVCPLCRLSLTCGSHISGIRP